MVTKKELRDFRKARKEVNVLREQLLEVRSTMGGLKAQIITDMPKGNQQKNALEEAVVRMDELQIYYATKIMLIYVEQDRIEKSMRVLDSTEATAIRAYYFQAKDWKTVAKEMDYTKEGINKIHGRAIKKLRDYETVH